MIYFRQLNAKLRLVDPGLGNHSPPGNYIYFESLAGLLLEQLDGPEKAVEVLVNAVIPPMKSVVAGGQIGGQGRRIVVLQGRGIRVEFSVFVVGKASDFLKASASTGISSRILPWAV
jgi:hypothetical protein